MDCIGLTDKINKLLLTATGEVADTLILVRDELIPQCIHAKIAAIELEIEVLEGEILLAEESNQ